MQVKILIFKAALLRQQPGIADTRDRPTVLRGFNEPVVFTAKEIKILSNLWLTPYFVSLCGQKKFKKLITIV